MTATLATPTSGVATVPAVFANAVAIAAKLLSKSATAPILQHVRLTCNAGAMVVTSTDLIATISLSVPVLTGADFVACVDGRRLNAIVRGAKSPIRLALVDDALVVEIGSARVHLPTLDASEFPTTEPRDFALLTYVNDSFADIRDALVRAQTFTSHEEARGAALGSIAIAPRETTIVATDDYHLLVQPSPLVDDGSGTTAEFAPVLLPRSVATALSSLRIPKFNAVNVQTTLFGSRTIADQQATSAARAVKFTVLFRGPADAEICATITMLTFDGCYVDYHRVIPEVPSGYDYRVNIAALREVVKSAARVRPEWGQVRLLLSLDAEEGATGSLPLRVSIKADDRQVQFEDTVVIEAVAHAGPVTICVNGPLLTESLSGFRPEVEYATLHLNGPLRPFVLRDSAFANATTIVQMPLRQ